MNKREVYRLGKQRGRNIASWIETPEDGQEIPRHLDWVGHKIVSSNNWKNVFLSCCSDAESNNRDYSPFEFTASEINDSRDPDTMWAEFERGIEAGFRQEMRTRRFEKKRKAA